MAKLYTIKGVDKVMKNLNKKTSSFQKNITSAGYIRVAMEIYRRVDTDTPLVPVDTGNLRASYFAFVQDSQGSESSFSSTAGRKKGVKQELLQQQQANKSRAKSMLKKLAKNGGMVFGFAANYAIPVHENHTANWKRPGAGSNYFLAHLKAAKGTIIKILKDSAK